MAWLAIWDSSGQILGASSGNNDRLPEGALIFETRLTTCAGLPVALWRGQAEGPGRLELTWKPDGTITLNHGPITYHTSPDFLVPGEVIHLHYSWDRSGYAGEIVLHNAERGLRQRLRTGLRADVRLADIMPAKITDHAALGLAGIASHLAVAGPVSGFGKGTPIDTPDGPVPVETLAPGMDVCTIDNGVQTVRWIGTREVLARGAMAPVRLRAPYFGLPQDVLVSRNHRVMMSGANVEYLFGAERVLARAGDLVNGVSAGLHLRQPTQTYYHFLLDSYDCVSVGRCRLESLLLADLLISQGKSPARLDAADRAPACPTLDRAGTQSLLALLAEHRRVAA